MKIYGDADLTDSELLNAKLSSNIIVKPINSLPSPPHGEGHLVFSNDVLYICVSVNPEVWIPLTKEISAYAHTQAVSSSTWYIIHNLNTTDIVITIYNSDDQVIIPDSIAITGANTATVTLSTASTGRAVVVTGTIEGPARTASDGSIIVDWSNITNIPTFNAVTSGELTINATTAAPTKATTKTTDWINVVDEGNGWCTCQFSYSHTSSAGSADGLGSYLFTLPAGFQMDSTYHPFNTAASFATQGNVYTIIPGSKAAVSGDTFQGESVIVPYNSTSFRMVNFGSQWNNEPSDTGTSNFSWVGETDWNMNQDNVAYIGSFRFKKNTLPPP
jgi:hypothetical protein